MARSFPLPPIRARAAVVLDADTGHIMVALNPHLRLPIASTTKIMTALLAVKMGHLTDRIVVPKTAFNYESDATAMGLHPGQVVTLKDLLYGLMLPSGADAANTIAIHYGGSEARFVAMMNREAALFGMHDTHYVNAHGLDAPGEHSSAYDLAILGQDVSSIPEIMNIAATRTYHWNGHTLTNLNHVLFWYPNVDGIKPGYTGDAGLCQVLDARRNGRHIIVALLNTPDLVIDARDLLNYGLNDFTWAQSDLPADSPYLVYQGNDYQYFIGSGHYLGGQFLSAYKTSGDLAGLGFPRTEALREGNAEVQYFQNGALSLNLSSNRVTRLALGLTPLPTPSPTPTSAPATIAPPYYADAHTSAGHTAPGHSTPTATPLPHLTGTATPTPQTTPVTAPLFATFQRRHSKLLGSAAGSLQYIHGYAVQFFAYGALTYDGKSKAVYLLPLGDRLLAARHFLADRPGTAYPTGFAPVSILKALGWPPYTAGLTRTRGKQG